MGGLIGKKIGMTSVFTETGLNVACTVIQAGPCVVMQVKTKETDGYNAIQLGFEDKKEKHSNKPELGHALKSGGTPKKRIVEFRDMQGDYKAGDIITAEYFDGTLWVDVAGNSKGKGFQGVVKRHGFSGVGGRTHGQHNRGRAPGSVGASSYPSKVFKGMRMAGQTGNTKVKVINLEIVKIIKEQNLILLKGSVPGSKGSYLIIEK